MARWTRLADGHSGFLLAARNGHGYDAEFWYLDLETGAHVKTQEPLPAAPEPETCHIGRYRFALLGLDLDLDFEPGPRDPSPRDLCASCEHACGALAVSHWSCCGAFAFFAPECRASPKAGAQACPKAGPMLPLRGKPVSCAQCGRLSGTSLACWRGDFCYELCPACFLEEQEQEMKLDRFGFVKAGVHWACSACQQQASPLAVCIWNEEQKERTCLRCAAGHAGAFRDTDQFKLWDQEQVQKGKWSWCCRALGHAGAASCGHLAPVICLPHWTCCGSRDPESTVCQEPLDDPDVDLVNELLRRLVRALDLGPDARNRSKQTVLSCAAGIAALKSFVDAFLADRAVRRGFRSEQFHADFSGAAPVCAAAFAVLAGWLVSALHPDLFVLESEQERFLQDCLEVVARVPSLQRYLEQNLERVRGDPLWVALG
jgi:hypothetical protein